MRIPCRLPATAGICLLWSLILFWGVGCTTTHSARTLGKGNLGVEATLGGPITTNLGGPVPIPNLFLGARYGILDTVDVSAALNATAPVIPGFALDLQTAVHWFPIQPGLRSQGGDPDRGWGLGGTLGVDWMSDFQSGLVVLPYLEVAGGYRRKAMQPFLGVALAVNAYRPLEERDILMLSPFVGVELRMGRHSWFSIRATVYDCVHNAYGGQVAWLYLVEDPDAEKLYGPVGVSFGYSWDLEGGRDEK